MLACPISTSQFTPGPWRADYSRNVLSGPARGKKTRRDVIAVYQDCGNAVGTYGAAAINAAFAIAFEPTNSMKIIVYFEDGAMEATANADLLVASGEARFASPAEAKSYEQHFETCDKGRKLELASSTLFAAQQIYKASSPLRVSPVRFFEKNEVAMADIERCAEEEAKAAS